MNRENLGTAHFNIAVQNLLSFHLQNIIIQIISAMNKQLYKQWTSNYTNNGQSVIQIMDKHRIGQPEKKFLNEHVHDKFSSQHTPRQQQMNTASVKRPHHPTANSFLLPPSSQLRQPDG